MNFVIVKVVKSTNKIKEMEQLKKAETFSEIPLINMLNVLIEYEAKEKERVARRIAQGRAMGLDSHMTSGSALSKTKDLTATWYKACVKYQEAIGALDKEKGGLRKPLKNKLWESFKPALRSRVYEGYREEVPKPETYEEFEISVVMGNYPEFRKWVLRVFAPTKLEEFEWPKFLVTSDVSFELV